jgi:hypothetical protein
MSETEDPANDDTFSPGETGEAVEADEAECVAGTADVIVGEIPDADELTRMLWTARCTFPAHGRLGTFDVREQAEEAKRRHLLDRHGQSE